MRRSISIIVTATALGGFAGATVIFWRRNPRVGTTFVNSVVNPRLVRRGLAGGRASEIGTLEHIGRRSGVRRLTPVHPEPTPEGFRVVVPLGPNSQWAQNVLAAGHCRLQLHDRVYDLDEPAMIPASEAEKLPWAVRGAMAAVGFQYLRLHTFASHPGRLEPAESDASVSGQQSAGQTSARDLVGEPVSSTH